MPTTDSTTDTEHANLGYQQLTRNLLVLSVPIVVSQFAQLANGIVDIIMAGRLSVDALAAISVGAALWTPMMIFLVGLLYAMVPIIGKLLGEGQNNLVLEVVVRGLIVGVVAGVMLGLALFFFCTPLFAVIGVSPELIADASSYVKLTAFGLPGVGIFLAVRFMTEANGEPLLVTISLACGVVLKILCNMAFVFGYFGAPTFGASGFGLASIIVFWGTAFAIIALGLLKANIRSIWKSSLNKAALSVKNICAFIVFGLPIALNFLSEYFVMSVVSLFIATISALAISSHQIAFNFLMILTIIPSGISMAATILIAQAVGRHDNTGILKIIIITLGKGTLLALLLSVLTYYYAKEISSLYSDNEALINPTSQLLAIIALLLVVDVAVITLGFLLRGLDDPTGPLYILAIAHWLISIPLGYVLAFTDYLGSPMGVQGWWYGLLCGLLAALVLMLVRIKRILRQLDI